MGALRRVLNARARARFASWIRIDRSTSAADAAGAQQVLDGWTDGLDAIRGKLERITGDSRMHWLPMALAFRADEYETPAQIDSLLALALGNGFSDGNAVEYIHAPAFQYSLVRLCGWSDRRRWTLCCRRSPTSGDVSAACWSPPSEDQPRIDAGIALTATRSTDH